MPKHTPRRADAPGRPSRHNPNAPQTFELVELGWILKALGGIFALALLCGYITLCVVYSRTQWQLVLHPSRQVSTTPASVGLPFTEVRFSADDSGQSQLDGWWIPGDAPSDPVVILLHNGDSDIGDALPIAQSLHDARLNILLFDYRGYGLSGGQHPTEATMEADSDSAFTYLTSTRNISAGNILAYGTGVGGSLAVRLCLEHPQIAALILDHPDGDLKARALADSRSNLLPVRWLFAQDFPLAKPLQILSTPKLLISPPTVAPPPQLAYATNPKMTVELPSTDTAALHQALTRFLSTYVTHPPATLRPNP